MTAEYYEVDYMNWYGKISKVSTQDTYTKYINKVEYNIYNLLSFMLKREKKGIMELFAGGI